MKQAFDIAKISEAFAAAALDSTRWKDAIELASAATGSLGAVMFPVRGALPYVPASDALHRVFEVYVRDGWVERDERLQLGAAPLIEKGIVIDSDVRTPDQMRSSAYYQDFLARCGVGSFVGVRVGVGEQIWSVSIQRKPEQGMFNGSELRSLTKLARSLDSVAATANALAFARGEGALDAFDITEKAAFLLDRRGDVVRINQAAEAMLGLDVFIRRRRLTSRSAAATMDLNGTIRDLLWTQTASSAPAIIFPRHERLPLLVYAIRCPGLAESALSSFHAMVVIVDPEQRSLPTAKTLQAGFDLTPAEARLAIALGAGSDLQSEALKLGVSHDTVRKHLKSIFAKTGVGRQSELVALLAALLSE